MKKGLKNKKKRIYLDYASSSPELAVSISTSSKLKGIFGNPSSIHKDGVDARKILEESRGKVAKVLFSQPDEIIFVGSGTESDNLAILGVFKSARTSLDFKGKDIHIITTVTEHPAVLEACRHLEKVGALVTYLSVNKDGLIDMKEFKNALRPETILVSIAYANNEIGVIQPIKEIAKEIRRHRKNSGNIYPYFHIDACQAGSYLNINVEQLGVDMMTLNGTKIGGPRGTGILYKKRGVMLEPIIYGGGHEAGFRSGTENVAGISGFAIALEDTQKNTSRESLRVSKLQDYFITELKKCFPDCRVNGSLVWRLPNNVSVSFHGITSELLVIELDAKGISASAGSACSSAKEPDSYVLEALYGTGDADKFGTVRFSFGRETTKQELASTLKALKEIFEKYSPWKKS